MSKIHDLVTSTEKPTSSTRKGDRYTFAGFRRADEEQKRLAREERHRIEVENLSKEATALRAIEIAEKRITEEQNRIKRDNFVRGKLSNAFGTNISETVVIEQEQVNNKLNKAFVPTKDFPEPFEAEPALNRELSEFKKKIHEHVAQLGLAHSSGGGAGFMIDLDDVQTSTAKVDGKFLKYSSSDSKWIGADASGTPAADDISAGDGAVNITTTSGDITIDAAANNTDIIFKGTDATADITMLTLDGSAAGAATFNDKIVATELDISGDVDVDGTLETDAFSIGGTTVSSTAAELNYNDTGAAVGTVVASKTVTVDSNKDVASFRNITLTGELDAATLDISGDADIDGTLEADAYTVDGTTLAEYIADTAGAMVSSNTETGIAVTYQDSDNTIDFAVDAAQTAITSIYNSSLAIGYGSSHANIDFGTDNRIVFDIDGTSQVLVLDGVFRPTTDSDVDLGASAKYWKDAYIDTITTTGAITSGGILKTDDATEATSTTDGSLQTDGGLSVVKDAVFGDDVKLLSDSAVLNFGADSDVTITHAADASLTIAGGTAAQLIMSSGSILPSTDTDTSNTGSVTLNFQTNQNFVLTFTGNVTLANPSTETAGQAGVIVCIQDGTGGRTLSLGTDYETAAGAGITLSTAANAVDVIPYFVKAAGSIQLGAVQKAFS